MDNHKKIKPKPVLGKPNAAVVEAAILALHAQVKAEREAKGLPTTRRKK